MTKNKKTAYSNIGINGFNLVYTLYVKVHKKSRHTTFYSNMPADFN